MSERETNVADTALSTTPPRRRSVHFVPGGNERFLTRALASAADALVFDLEDSVRAEHKAAARQAVAEWLAPGALDAGGKEVMVRINEPDSPWWAADVAALAPLDPPTFMIPKVSTPTELDTIEAALIEHHARTRTRFFPVATETAAGVLAADRIAGHQRVDGVCWGAEDLSTALGALSGRDQSGELRPVFRVVQSLCLIGAAAGGVGAVDAVWTDLRDLDGLARESTESAAMGFVGKVTIHPDQVDIVNRAFTPSEDLVARSEELLDVYREHQRTGSGALRFRGEMVDQPHITRAQRIVAAARNDEDAG